MNKLMPFLLTLAISISLRAQSGPCVVPGRGHFQVHVGTAGLFGVFAHDHLIESQKTEGCVKLDAKDIANSSVRLVFAASGMKVLDPSESAKDRATVQQTM